MNWDNRYDFSIGTHYYKIWRYWEPRTRIWEISSQQILPYGEWLL